MESGKNKVTTKEQFEKLIEIMRKHPETGRGKPPFGCTKNKTKALWEDCAMQLNSLGPPTRTAKEWGRVWVHYKGNLKRKVANNRTNQIATGGGPSQEQSLNPLEESVVELIQIRTQVEPSGHAFGTTNIPPTSEEIGNSVDAAAAASMPTETNVPNEDDRDRPTTSGSHRTTNPRRNKSVETERLELLITQTETQKEVVRKLGKLEKAVNKNMEINRNVETERTEQLTMQTETQKEFAKKLGKLEKALNKNIELSEKALEIKQKKYALYEKQAQEASELHTLKVEVEKLKISKLQGDLTK